MSRFAGERYTARKQPLTLWGSVFRVYGPNQKLHFFVKQKAFRFKEAITIYRDESMATPLIRIRARHMIDFSAAYDISTPAGEALGVLKREGLRSLWRDRWLIQNNEGAEIGVIEEDHLALARRLMLHLLPQAFYVQLYGQRVAVFRQHLNPFVARFDIDFSLDTEQLLDRRLGIAAAVLLLAIERRRG
ncbi:hypothetical protein DN745_11120 [Bradymonas sediminis]|uniref:Uncharacterized protein n=1 Tax=Bradymonas sediminis TaxID=1548548 RepID=A0A2Z4FM00_9DELT|nr:hypothetical protein DN745_11120 [Bradymonas sediminis]